MVIFFFKSTFDTWIKRIHSCEDEVNIKLMNLDQCATKEVKDTFETLRNDGRNFESNSFVLSSFSIQHDDNHYSDYETYADKLFYL